MKEKNITITIKAIGEHFNKSSREINKIFEELQWIEKKGRWWVLTSSGETKGGKELYNPKNKTKYTIWKDTILKEIKLIDKITLSSEQNEKTKLNQPTNINGYDSFYKKDNKKTLSKQEKKAKGDMYEAYIADFFKEKGYYVWEHGKEKGRKDGGIDLFIKKGKQAYFIQCKNWETWKINDKIVKATQTDVRNYMIENESLTNLLTDCKKKILYITSKECLTKGAYRYIQENNNIIEYKVIPMETVVIH